MLSFGCQKQYCLGSGYGDRGAADSNIPATILRGSTLINGRVERRAEGKFCNLVAGLERERCTA
jgi:hypothetical protein